MFCPTCGHHNEQDARFCINCGKALADVRAMPSPPAQLHYQNLPEPGRGATILVFGILSVVLLGLVAGIPAWAMGNRDLKKIRSGAIVAGQRGLTTAGMVLGIIGTLLSLGVVTAVAVLLGSAILTGPR